VNQLQETNKFVSRKKIDEYVFLGRVAEAGRTISVAVVVMMAILRDYRVSDF
jgi:hypothetical protein